MAGGTGNAGVRAGECECGIAMIKCGRQPCGRTVTCCTIVRQRRGDVVRVGRSLIICRMTLIAIGERELEVSVRMAGITRHAHMRAREREMGCCMIKGCRAPPCLRVASKTVVIESGMDRVGSAGKITLMTGVTT